MKTALIFDTETTGIPDWKIPSDDPKQPHIVQAAGLVVDLGTGNIIHSINLIAQPDGWEIPQVCVDIHGITTEHAMDVGIPEYVVAGIVMELAKNRKRVAFNTTFDNRIIRIALKRFMGQAVADEWKAGEYECAMILAKKIMGGKQPKLEAAYKHFTGNELVGAHDAMADTTAALAVYNACKAHSSQTPDKTPAFTPALDTPIDQF